MTKEEKIEAARNWIEKLPYDEFQRLNEKQISVINMIKDEYHGDFILKINTLGVTKVNNYLNSDNYDYDEWEQWDDNLKKHIKVEGYIPRREWLKKIINNER